MTINKHYWAGVRDISNAIYPKLSIEMKAQMFNGQQSIWFSTLVEVNNRLVPVQYQYSFKHSDFKDFLGLFKTANTIFEEHVENTKNNYIVTNDNSISKN